MSQNYIEVHCYLEADKNKDSEYSLLIRIGNTEFGGADGYKGRSSAMRAAKRVSKVIGLPIKETEL